MTKHSKNRTAAPVFSYAERNSTQYGSKKQRLGRESLRNFDACALCLQRARDARMCEEGHIFCQECVVTALLSQKKEIKRQALLLEQMKLEEEQEKQAARQSARERVLAEFEQLQSGKPATRVAGPSANGSAATANVSETSAVTSTTGLGGERGVKRKFELDDSEINRLADEQEEKAMKEIEREQAEKRKAKLPNFWLPSLTPEAAPTRLSEVKLQTLCHAGDPAHPLSLKSLTVVNFRRSDDATSASGSTTPGAAPAKANAEAEYICPCCRKTLSNNVASFVLKPCGHVLCNTCIDTLVRPNAPMQCAHCDAKLLADKKKPIVPLKREGTGYAAGGMAEAKRFNLAFQA